MDSPRSEHEEFALSNDNTFLLAIRLDETRRDLQVRILVRQNGDPVASVAKKLPDARKLAVLDYRVRQIVHGLLSVSSGASEKLLSGVASREAETRLGEALQCRDVAAVLAEDFAEILLRFVVLAQYLRAKNEH